MTRGELRTEVFRRLEEASSAPVFWTADDIDTALDDAYTELSDATEWCERWVTVDLLASRPYYDLRYILPYECLSVGAAFNEQTNRWLKPSRPREMDQADRRWEDHVGEPERLMVRGLHFLGYWPMVASDSGTVKQYYTSLPDPLEDDEDEPGFDEVFHEGLIAYALADLWAQDGEVTLALGAWKTYLAYEAALTAFVQGRLSIPLVHGFVEHAQVSS